MKDAKAVIPWKVTDISIRPYDGFWSFNPSIHFDGERWLCAVRCCDYAMPDGVTIRSKTSRSVGQQTKNAMVVFEPQSWRPIKIYKMQEKDGFPRAPTPHVGFEDMRLFKTDKGGLQGIAASLHLRRDREQRAAASENKPQHQPPEQVLLSFDENYDIVAARPIRGDGWSGTPQKNWVPFDHCLEPRFLYSIDKGSMFDERGAVHGAEARVRPSIVTRSPTSAVITASTLEVDQSPAAVSAAPPQEQEAPVVQPAQPKKHARRPPTIRGGDVKIMRGRMALDAMASRPSARPSGHHVNALTRRSEGSTRIMGSGRALPPKYPGLRGGTQLVHVADDAWLGIGHEMKFVSGKKFYWHRWYLVDSRGKMTSASEPMKLVANGIEFAAGMALDGDRLVVSFGVDDMECKIGETHLSAVLEKLMPMAR